jgi:hypothetical protein
LLIGFGQPGSEASGDTADIVPTGRGARPAPVGTYLYVITACDAGAAALAGPAIRAPRVTRSKAVTPATALEAFDTTERSPFQLGTKGLLAFLGIMHEDRRARQVVAAEAEPDEAGQLPYRLDRRQPAVAGVEMADQR